MSKNSLIISKSSNAAAEGQFSVEMAAAADLVVVNRIVASAVASWPVPDRLKRLSLPLLQYSQADLTEFQFFVFDQSGTGKGVAVLSKDTTFTGRNESRCALLHGLYVEADSQRSGIGGILQRTVADRARKSGTEGLLVKAQRVSRSYFEAQGYVECVSSSIDYPYLYWKAI
jgi:N-acetylglutamate synthase-like GNAT family acetyltransferase